MSLLANIPFVTLTDFGGAHLYLNAPYDPTSVPVPNALYAANVEYLDGSVATRHGWGVAFSTTDTVASLHNFLSSAGNALVWYASSSGVRLIDVANPPTTGDLIGGSAIASAAVFANSGSNLYAAYFNSSAYSTVQGNVFVYFGTVDAAVFTGAGLNDLTSSGTATTLNTHTYTVRVSVAAGTDSFQWKKDSGTYSASIAMTGAAQALSDGVSITFAATTGHTLLDQWAIFTHPFADDKPFEPPMTYTPAAPTEPGAGVVTAGSHRIGYIVTTRSGFTGRPSPDSGVGTPSVNTFTYLTFTSAGSKNLRIVLNPTLPGWPVASASVAIIMTPANNPNDWRFVPGATATLPRNGGASSKTIDINISDDDLIATGQDATPYLYLATQIVGGASGPFNPSVVVQLGNRMGYITRVTDSAGNPAGGIYISDKNAYQSVTLDQHLKQLPGLLDLTTATSTGGSTYYLFGPHWTYSVSDNGNVPVLWPAPVLIDGRRGTLAPRGVDFSPANGILWVADQDGLYPLIGNQYQSKPISYYQTADWRLIDWSTAAYAVQVKDNSNEKVVTVCAQLNGGTTCEMSWDYTDGITAEAAKYSYNSLATGSNRSIAIVQNDLPTAVAEAKSKLELWHGGSNPTGITRTKCESDSNPYRDLSSSAVGWSYITAMLPGKGVVPGWLNHKGFQARIKGVGTITPIIHSMDGTKTVTCTTKSLAVSPDKELWWKANINSELIYIEFGQAGPDGNHATISMVRAFYTPLVTARP